MKLLLRNSLLALLAAFMAVMAILCLPLLNGLLHDDRGPAKPRIVAAVSVKTVEAPPPKMEKKREVHQPVRARPTQTALRAGPRFAMDLGVAGASGAAAPLDIVNKRSGGGGSKGAATGDDVDERPSPQQPPPFRIPDAIKEAEKDAYLVLAFCVDGQGRAYDISIVEEKPSGMGLGAAGREALQRTSFQPARKGGLPVSFCGLEQPFEVRFSN